MQLRRKGVLVIFVLVMVLSALAGCSGKNQPGEGTKNPESSSTASPKSSDPVVITIAWPWGEKEYEARFGGIREKLKGEIDVRMVQVDGTKEKLQELFASKTIPDIIVANHGLRPLEELDTLMSIEELMKKHNFEESIVNPFALAYVRAIDTKGRLVGLPDGLGGQTLYYNKEVFDLFGEPYPDPQTPMTWDELLDLVQRLTTTRDGKTYIGLHLFDTMAYAPLEEFPANATDPDTGEMRLTKDPAFTRHFEFLKRLYSIPGIKEARGRDMFMERSAAMVLQNHNFLAPDWQENESLKKSVDMIPIPVWPDQPTLTPVGSNAPITINKYSQKQDDAFRVLAEYYSPDIQLQMIRPAHATPAVSDMEIVKQWAADVPGFQGKNMDANFIFNKNRATYNPRKSPWDAYIDRAEAIEKFVQSDMDIVKFLREWEEEAAGKVKDAMAQYSN
ncbi:ABC transporter substrate-binding protein [Paenibacillus sp. IITD108]|uniref:ABC transporter substrate-binding protein n=1 Tax=Paenibacillus sp. IITD108 TaxID=3116649 RepID=UPI002F3ECA86